ncbi:MAG TPA: hypothetical protein DDZ51_21115, partial [Planctomycetaceae bacterium]|nr:hypothetical protein [Planctomycetaceae bacterium]
MRQIANRSCCYDYRYTRGRRACTLPGESAATFMILINWLLGFGALAFTVPLAIHLLFRNRFEVVDWGAMQFLQSVVRQNRRRMQLRNLLLLLIRCAIPMLLAFCMARPVMTQWRQ